MFKTIDLQDIIYAPMATDINVAINNLYLFKPNLIPSVETQLLFKEATQNNYKISYDEHYTERRVISDMIVQLDIGPAQQVSSPKYLVCAHQTQNRRKVHNKKTNIAIFDNLDLRKNYVQRDGLRYHRDSLLINYLENFCMERYKDLKIFFEAYNGEPIINLLI